MSAYYENRVQLVPRESHQEKALLDTLFRNIVKEVWNEEITSGK